MGAVPQKVLNWLHGAINSVGNLSTILRVLVANSNIRSTEIFRAPTRMLPKRCHTIPTSLSGQMSIVWNGFSCAHPDSSIDAR